MYFLIEILVDLILVLLVNMIRWCFTNKRTTLMILAIVLAVVDVFALYYIVTTR